MSRRLGSGLVDSLKSVGRTFSHHSHATSQPSTPLDPSGVNIMQPSPLSSGLLERRGSAHLSIASTSSSSSIRSRKSPRASTKQAERMPRLSFGGSSKSHRPHRDRAHSDSALEKVPEAPPDEGLYQTKTIQLGVNGHSSPRNSNSFSIRRPSTSRNVEHTSPFTWKHFWSNLIHSQTPHPDAEALDISPAETPMVAPEPKGPRRGEIDCLVYDSVNDLRKMEALSDHRPVYAVFAIGAGPPAADGRH
jgi:hypothetical protein